MDETLTVSIVIPTYNRLHKLSMALASIERMDFDVNDYEVIIVDDGSTDGTGEYINDLNMKTTFKLIYLYQKNSGPAAARNNGIRTARGQYLLIIDSDCFVDRNILKHYLRHFPDAKLGGVGGNVLPDDLNLITEYLDHIGAWRPGDGANGISYLVTANAFFAKEAVVKAGYFDEDFRQPGGEEPELCYRMRNMGYRFEYDKDAVVVHSHRTTLKGMIKMFYIHGKGNAIFLKKWPELPRRKTSFLRIITGVNSFRRFLFDYARNVNIGKAVIFFVLDYLSYFASHYGYSSVIKGSDV